MAGSTDMDRAREAEEAWRRDTADAPEDPRLYSTLSDIPVERVYTPLHLEERDYQRDIGLPGQFPFTRGVHPTGYRGKLWTMRMFAGFGTPAETNQRFKFLLDHGETGLSTAFDMPTLYGYDTDAPRPPASSAAAAPPSLPSRTWRSSSRTSPWTRSPPP